MILKMAFFALGMLGVITPASVLVGAMTRPIVGVLFWVVAGATILHELKKVKN